METYDLYYYILYVKVNNMIYIISITKQWPGGILQMYIKKIFSYKKGKDGMVCTCEPELAHKYKQEKTALKASSFYSGTIIPFANKESM
jgi:hypothetical protein